MRRTPISARSSACFVSLSLLLACSKPVEKAAAPPTAPEAVEAEDAGVEPSDAGVAPAPPAPRPERKRRKVKLAEKGYDPERITEQRAMVAVQSKRAEDLGQEIAQVKAELMARKLAHLRVLARRRGWTLGEEPVQDRERKVWRQWVKLEREVEGDETSP